MLIWEDRHLRHIDERLHAVMFRHRRRIDRRSQIDVRNRHAEVHRLAAGNRLMHGIEIEQIADHNFPSSVRTIARTALPARNSSSVDRASNRADAARPRQ